MEAFAVVGLDCHGPSKDEIGHEEWAQCIVKVAVCLGDNPTLPAGSCWEQCAGSMNGGFGLRRASIAVERAGSNKGHFRYVSGIKVCGRSPGREWQRCGTPDGSDAAPSLCPGRRRHPPCLFFLSLIHI